MTIYVPSITPLQLQLLTAKLERKLRIKLAAAENSKRNDRIEKARRRAKSEFECAARRRLRSRAEEIAAPVRAATCPIYITRAICSERLGVSVEKLISPSRKQPLTRNRQIAIYVVHHTTKKSSLEIGRKFGGRDHTTVLWAIRIVERLMAEDEDTRSLVKNLIADAAHKITEMKGLNNEVSTMDTTRRINTSENVEVAS